MLMGIEAREHRSVRGQRPGLLGEGVQEERPVLPQALEMGRGLPRIAIDGEMVPPRRVERDEHEVAWSLRRARRVSQGEPQEDPPLQMLEPGCVQSAARVRET